jgi:hypothetical protein
MVGMGSILNVRVVVVKLIQGAPSEGRAAIEQERAIKPKVRPALSAEGR